MRDSRIIQMPIEDEFDESDDEGPSVKFTQNPCINSFIAYRDENMEKITSGLYKQTIKMGFGVKVDTSEYKIKYEYELFLENAEDPFDSNKLTKKFGVIDEMANIGTLLGK